MGRQPGEGSGTQDEQGSHGKACEAGEELLGSKHQALGNS